MADWRIILLLLTLILAPLWSQSAGGDGPRIRPLSLRLIPSSVTLPSRAASHRFLVLGEYPDGLERDVTAECVFLVSDPTKGEIDDSGRFSGLQAGTVVLRARLGNQQAVARVRVPELGPERPFNFSRDIGAILTRRGCNGSDCHGSVTGRGGFKLSKNAANPREDHRWLVRGGTYQVLAAESKGKEIPRIDLGDPARSLLLLKPTMSIPHGGGERFSLGSPDYLTLLNWIRIGAPLGERGAGEEVSIREVSVFPKQSVLDGKGSQQLLVVAHLKNGDREDISGQVLFVSSNPDVVKVSETGLVRAVAKGEATVWVRTVGHTANTAFAVIDQPVKDYPEIPRRNFIDRLVFDKLRRLNLIPAGLASDGEFLRRVCLDLTGTLPPPQRVREFLSSDDPSKRDRLIERLLGSPEYVDYWSFRFSDLMRVTLTSGGKASKTKAYEDWVTASVIANKPYDQMAVERVAAQGYGAPTKNFFLAGSPIVPAKMMAEHVRVFLGRRLDCAQCHDHPYENWTQEQFWGLTAFYGGLSELVEGHIVLDTLGGAHVDRREDRTVIHPRTNQPMLPTFLDGSRLPQEQWLDPRLQLAQWMTSHPYFSEAAVNRIWGYFFGRGIVDPVDDFRTTNPPTHPKLLAELAKEFRDRGYDLQSLMRTIVQSRTYQLSAEPPPSDRGDKLNYSRARTRPLEAAVLLDAVSRATAVEEEFNLHDIVGGGKAPPGTRAMQMIPDLCPSTFMEVYGQSMRKTPASGNPDPNLRQALHIWAGPAYTSKISKPGGRLDRLLGEEASDAEIIEEFYLASLTRFPTIREKTQLLGFLKERRARRKETLEGLLWALISSREFAYNH